MVWRPAATSDLDLRSPIRIESGNGVRADHVLSRELKLPEEELATGQRQRPAHSADRLVESEVKTTIGRPPAPARAPSSLE